MRNVGIAILTIIVVMLSTSGCIERHSSSDNWPVLSTFQISGPYLATESGENPLIGAYYDYNDDFCHLYLNNNEDSVIIHNNRTDDHDTIFQVDGEIRGTDLFETGLAVYYVTPIDFGTSHQFTISHVNISSGSETLIERVRVNGDSDAEDDPFKMVASAGDYGVAYLKRPHEDGTKWSFVLRNLQQDEITVDEEVEVHNILSSDSERSGDVLGLVNDDQQMRIYRLQGEQYNCIIELNHVKHVTMDENRTGYIDLDGIHIAEGHDLNNLTLLNDTNSSETMDILGGIIAFSNSTGVYLKHNTLHIKICESMRDLWIVKASNLKIHMTGTIETSNHASSAGHFDIRSTGNFFV